MLEWRRETLRDFQTDTSRPPSSADLQACEQQRRYQSLEWGRWPIPVQGHIKECECSSTNRNAGGQGHWLRDLVISELMWSTMESSYKSTMSLCDLQLEGYKPEAMWAGWERCTVLTHSNMHRDTEFGTYTQSHTQTERSRHKESDYTLSNIFSSLSLTLSLPLFCLSRSSQSSSFYRIHIETSKLKHISFFMHKSRAVISKDAGNKWQW